MSNVVFQDEPLAPRAVAAYGRAMGTLGHFERYFDSSEASPGAGRLAAAGRRV